MGTMARDAGGRRLYTAEFKRQQLARVERGELTASELSRELGIARSLIQRWKYLATKGSETAVGANEDVVPVSELRAAQQRIREIGAGAWAEDDGSGDPPGRARQGQKKPRWYGVSKPRPDAP
jgi:transposase-like protein